MCVLDGNCNLMPITINQIIDKTVVTIIYHCDQRDSMQRSCCSLCSYGERHTDMTNPIIDVHEGKLKGEKCKTANSVVYYSFKKIPYAKPPEGELRFSVSFFKFNLDLFSILLHNNFKLNWC